MDSDSERQLVLRCKLLELNVADLEQQMTVVTATTERLRANVLRINTLSRELAEDVDDALLAARGRRDMGRGKGTATVAPDGPYTGHGGKGGKGSLRSLHLTPAP